MAQNDVPFPTDETEGGAPAIVPQVKVGQIVLDGDTALYLELQDVYVIPPPTLRTQRQRQQYNRLVRNVKKVLPIAKEIRSLIIETAQVLETIPTKKQRQQHMRRVEKEIVKAYTPRMKKLTFAQGKLLIRLVDRECHSTAYEAMQAFIGPFRSGLWQAFAWTFGASLKKSYDPEGDDRLTEQVVLMVEAGQI